MSGAFFPSDPEAVVERLDEEREFLIGVLRETTEGLDELAGAIDDQVAEVDYFAVEQGLERLALPGGIREQLGELGLLGRIWFGERVSEPDAQPVDLPPLDRDALFADAADDSGDAAEDDPDDDPTELAQERVHVVGRHLHLCIEAVRDSLDHAIDLAEAGHTLAAGEAFEDAQRFVVQARDTFALWCEVLEGVLFQTGSYPGVAGEQVTTFMTWLDQQRQAE